MMHSNIGGGVIFTRYMGLTDSPVGSAGKTCHGVFPVRHGSQGGCVAELADRGDGGSTGQGWYGVKRQV